MHREKLDMRSLGSHGGTSLFDVKIQDPLTCARVGDGGSSANPLGIQIRCGLLSSPDTAHTWPKPDLGTRFIPYRSLLQEAGIRKHIEEFYLPVHYSLRERVPILLWPEVFSFSSTRHFW